MRSLGIGLLCSWVGIMSATAGPAEGDWAQLGYYRAANEALLKAADTRSDKGARVVFMGDSITEGWKAADPSFFGESGHVNRGISGQTTSQMLVRFRQDVIDLRPRAVVILAGTNDIAGNTGPVTEDVIAGHIASMADLALAHGIRVVLVSVLPADRYDWAPAVKPAERIVALNLKLQTWAQSRGVLWVDLHTPMSNSKLGLSQPYANDGVHPTVAGYAVMRPAIEKALARALR